MADNTKNKENKSNKTRKTFFKDVKAELKKVTWPTAKQVTNSTAGVITIVVITAAIVFALDFAFNNFNKYVVNDIKGKVSSNSVSEENSAVENDVAENTEIENSINE